MLDQETCLDNIKMAITKYHTIEYYLDEIFEKDITTKYKPRQKGLRVGPELESVTVPVEGKEIVEGNEIFDIEPKKKVKRLKSKKIKEALVLEEVEEDFEEPVREEPKLGDILLEERIDITPVKRRKTRKQREQNLKANPRGKKGTRRKLPEDVAIVGDLEIVN